MKTLVETYNNFDELVINVLAHSNDEEVKRINDEVDLIKKRNWGEYFVMLSNMLPKLVDNGCFLSSTVMDSYLLSKSMNPNEYNTKLLNNKIAYNALFNNDLQLDIKNVWGPLLLEEMKQKTFDIINDCIIPGGFVLNDKYENKDNHSDNEYFFLIFHHDMDETFVNLKLIVDKKIHNIDINNKEIECKRNFLLINIKNIEGL